MLCFGAKRTSKPSLVNEIGLAGADPEKAGVGGSTPSRGTNHTSQFKIVEETEALRKQKPWMGCRRQFVSSTSPAFQVSLKVYRVAGPQAAKPTPAVAFICALSWRARDKTVKPTPG